MNESILTSIKKLLGIDEDLTAFDADVMMNINSAINVLTQNGVGPSEGFKIESKDETWSDFFDDDLLLQMVKTYVYIKVRLIFDPPQASAVIACYEEQANETLWRILTIVDKRDNKDE